MRYLVHRRQTCRLPIHRGLLWTRRRDYGLMRHWSRLVTRSSRVYWMTFFLNQGGHLIFPAESRWRRCRRSVAAEIVRASYILAASTCVFGKSAAMVRSDNNGGTQKRSSLIQVPHYAGLGIIRRSVCWLTRRSGRQYRSDREEENGIEENQRAGMEWQDR